MPALRIILLCVAAAIVYGIAHDQITARVCIEYFTIGHPRIVDSTSPTVLAFVWGVLATWWVGLILGIVLSIAARIGRRPPRSAFELVRPVAILLAVMAACSLVAGMVGYFAASKGWVVLIGPLAERVPSERHVAFVADLWAHSAAYLVGFVGGIVVAVRVWRGRRGLQGLRRPAR